MLKEGFRGSSLRAFVPAAGCLLTLGCASLGNVQSAYESSSKVNAKDQCTLTMQLSNRDGSELRMLSEEACIRQGAALIALPTDLRLWLNDVRVWDSYQVCRDEPQPAAKENVETCHWNGVFRDSYPFTFTFKAGNVAAELQAVRVFRNGELVWVWVPQPNEHRTELVVTGNDLTGKLVPQNAALDLRIIPAGVSVDPVVLTARVQTRPSQWRTQLKLVEGAILTSPSIANGAVAERVECLRYRARMMNYYASQIAGATEPEPALPPNCDATVEKPPEGSLLLHYQSLKGKTQAEIDAAGQDLAKKIKDYEEKLSRKEREYLAQIREKLRASWAATGRTPAELSLLLDQADALITQGLQAVDDTLALAADLKRDAVRVANSPDEQARLFLRAANAVQSTSLFDPRVDNPEPIPGERGLSMRYSDHWQRFFFAPWTAFPVSMKGEPDFTAANLIPIVDAIGLRYQFSGSRLGDIRVGAGATVLSFTAEQTNPDSAGGTVITDKQQLRFAPEANIGLANLKLGIAYALAPRRLQKDEQWRILVGADLYKLVSGQNVEGGSN